VHQAAAPLSACPPVLCVTRRPTSSPCPGSTVRTGTGRLASPMVGQAC